MLSWSTKHEVYFAFSGSLFFIGITENLPLCGQFKFMVLTKSAYNLVGNCYFLEYLNSWFTCSRESNENWNPMNNNESTVLPFSTIVMIVYKFCWFGLFSWKFSRLIAIQKATFISKTIFKKTIELKICFWLGFFCNLLYNDDISPPLKKSVHLLLNFYRLYFRISMLLYRGEFLLLKEYTDGCIVVPVMLPKKDSC